MRTIRLYTSQILQAGASITLDKDASKHASQVLRLKSGYPVTLFNGDGWNYIGSIAESGKITRVDILHQEFNSSESSLRISLIQGISRSEKMDFTLQKSVELGVTEIQPVFCQRTILKLNEARLQKKISHWTSVIHSACEQSGRSTVPALKTPMNLNNYLSEKRSPETGIILEPSAIKTLGDVTPVYSGFELLIGPEGGFDQAEVDLAIRQGFVAVSLGPRVLRTETAGLAGIAILQNLHGDLS